MLKRHIWAAIIGGCLSSFLLMSLIAAGSFAPSDEYIREVIVYLFHGAITGIFIGLVSYKLKLANWAAFISTLLGWPLGFIIATWLLMSICSYYKCAGAIQRLGMMLLLFFTCVLSGSGIQITLWFLGRMNILRIVHH